MFQATLARFSHRSRLAALILGLAVVPAFGTEASAHVEPPSGGILLQFMQDAGLCDACGAGPPSGPAGCAYDFDCDGLNDSVEDSYAWSGLNRSNPDSDGDGLLDGDEFYNVTGWTYPNIYDSDGDGLGDGDEFFTHGTRNDAYDTDGDGWSDGAEVARGSNPNGYY